MFSASWIVTQLSTSVLSQSKRIARGRGRRLDAARSVDGPLTSATPTRAILASLSGRIFEYPYQEPRHAFFASSTSRFWASGNRQISPADQSELVEAGLTSICSRTV